MFFEINLKRERHWKKLQTDSSNRLEMAAISVVLISMQIRTSFDVM
jgi:hypothetical protein